MWHLCLYASRVAADFGGFLFASFCVFLRRNESDESNIIFLHSNLLVFVVNGTKCIYVCKQFESILISQIYLTRCEMLTRKSWFNHKNQTIPNEMLRKTQTRSHTHTHTCREGENVDCKAHRKIQQIWNSQQCRYNINATQTHTSHKFDLRGNSH